MHGKAKVFTLASVALLSCRAVLGIEEIEETEGATDGGADTNDAAADSPIDSPIDVGADTGADAGACSGKTGNECGKCCRDNGGPAYKTELEPIIKSCLCADGGACFGSCGTNICVNADPKDTPCIPCMDQQIKADACKKEKDDCAKSTSCKAIYDCIAACK